MSGLVAEGPPPGSFAPTAVHLAGQPLPVLQGAGIQVDELAVKIPGLARVLPDLMKLTPARGPWGEIPRPDLKDFAKYPMQVERPQLGLPEAAINRVVQQKDVPGLSELQVKVESGGRLKLSGVAHKVFDIPFEVQGRLLAQGDSQLRFRLESTTVGGFLPIPNLMTNFFASFASNEMARMQVRQEGDDYVIETKALVPENVRVAPFSSSQAPSSKNDDETTRTGRGEFLI